MYDSRGLSCQPTQFHPVRSGGGAAQGRSVGGAAPTVPCGAAATTTTTCSSPPLRALHTCCWHAVRLRGHATREALGCLAHRQEGLSVHFDRLACAPPGESATHRCNVHMYVAFSVGSMAHLVLRPSTVHMVPGELPNMVLRVRLPQAQRQGPKRRLLPVLPVVCNAHPHIGEGCGCGPAAVSTVPPGAGGGRQGRSPALQAEGKGPFDVHLTENRSRATSFQKRGTANWRTTVDA